MRHRSKVQYFNRPSGPRKAMLRSLVDALVANGRIRTTVAKAKELRRHVERAITLGKDDSLNTRRLLLSRYPNQKTVTTILTDLSKRFASRPGGYTRIIRLGDRPGDRAEMAFIEFVDYVLPTAETTKSEKKGKKAKAGEETVNKKADKKVIRQKSKAKLKLRKTVRKIQSESRRESRQA